MQSLKEIHAWAQMKVPLFMKVLFSWNFVEAKYRKNKTFLSFFLYILPGARFRALSADVHCTLRVAGCKPTSNHIEITVGFFNLHKGWLSLHRGHPVNNVPIRRTMHLSSVIPANDTKESVFGLQNFPRRKWGSNLGPLAPEASAITTELPRFLRETFVKWWNHSVIYWWM